MDDTSHSPVSGDALVADYETVIVSGVTIETAKYQAKHSEDSAINFLNSINSGSFLNPANIPTDTQETITRASVDAHIKKVQAQQMEEMGALQLQQLADKAHVRYKGKKVEVTVLNKAMRPIESAWFDNRYGWRKGDYNRNTLTGVIDEVLLDKNALILKPAFFSRMFNSSLKNYFVYIIDPNSLSPMVKLRLI